MLENHMKTGIAPTLLSPSCIHITYSLGISFVILDAVAMKHKGTWWQSWLRPCTTNQKVTGSIPNNVTGILIDIILPVTPWPWG